MTTDSSSAEAFESRLTDGTGRFLAHLIEHAFSLGRRTSQDFLRHFPPHDIMESLKDLPSLRADILEVATGVRRRVALKKSALSSGEDLQIALDEGEAASDEVVRLFRPDDRVRYLAREKLWAFLVEGEFWKVSKTDKAGYERAQNHVAFLLDRALHDQVLSHQDIIEGISVAKISQLMPRSELEVAFSSALSAGRRGQPSSDRHLYESLTAHALVNFIPLPHIWETVIIPCAMEHGLVEQPAAEAAADAPAERGEEAASEEPAPAPAVANSNSSESRITSQQKPVVKPLAAVKRGPMPTMAKVAAALAQPAGETAVEPEAAPPEADEEALFNAHFENLTASKTN